MSETSHPAEEPSTDWISSDSHPDASPEHHQPTSRNWSQTIGLLAAGALVGGIAIAALQAHASSSPNNAQRATNAALPGGPPGTNGQQPDGGVPGPGANGGPGGRSGEQHISGTLTSVGSSTITVTSTTGTTVTYAVTSETQILRNGNVVPLSALRAGDPVFVHVYPSGSRLVVERIFAGTMPDFGGPGGQAPPGAQQI